MLCVINLMIGVKKKILLKAEGLGTGFILIEFIKLTWRTNMEKVVLRIVYVVCGTICFLGYLYFMCKICKI